MDPRKRDEKRQVNRRSRRRTNKKKSPNKGLIFLSILILGILLYFLFSNIFGKEDEKPIEENDQVSQEENPGVNEKLDKASVIIANADTDLTNRIENFVDNTGLTSDNIKVLYHKLDEDKTYKYNDAGTIPMTNYNIFILSMLAEDLASQGKIDPNTTIKIYSYMDEDEASEVEEEDKDKVLSLSQVLEEAIIRHEDHMISAAKETVEKVTKEDWKLYASKLYQINISESNEMNFDDLNKVLTRLLSKDEGVYNYPETIESMLNKSSTREGLYALNSQEFIGVESVVRYNYILESGFVMGQDEFIYVVYGQYSDSSFLNQLRQILVDWHNEYK